MTEPRQHAPGTSTPAETDALFGRVAAILEQAQRHVVRAVNINMVQAYWLIGREIVQEVQGGETRAAYGQNIVADLSRRLTQRYGKGFSSTNLKYFRLFYQAFPDRMVIRHPVGDELPDTGALLQGFSPQLTWSHYRALMRVDSAKARHFYERDAIANSLYKYIDVATRTVDETAANVPVNVPVNEITAKILTLIRAQPQVTAQKMAMTLGVTDKTIKRHLKQLREQGLIQRVGSDKAGHWEIIERHA